MDPAKPSQKPLSYLVRRCVMQYMEANQRFTLAAHSPSLRSIHKAVPLTIDYLKLDETHFTLNDFRHEFHSFMEHPYGEQLPLALVLMNNDGGKPYDLNQFGDTDDEEYMELGDVKIPQGHVQPAPMRTPIRNVLRDMREVRRQAAREHQPVVPLEEEEERPVSPQPPPVKRTKREYFPYIQFSLQYLPRPTPFLKQKRIRFSPGVKIRDAIRDHLGTILTNNTLVRHLEITMDHGILRIPRSFKIQNLTLPPHVFEPLQPSIQWENSPLGTLHTTSVNSLLKNEMFRDFPRLRFTWGRDMIRNLVLRNLVNKEVYITDFQIPHPTVIKNLADAWNKNNREIGTKLSMELIDASRLENDLEFLKNELSGSKWKQSLGEVHPDHTRCVSLPMNATSELNFYVELSRNRENACVMVMEVLLPRSAI